MYKYLVDYILYRLRFHLYVSHLINNIILECNFIMNIKNENKIYKVI